MKPVQLKIEGVDRVLPIGTIYDTTQNETISFEEMLRRLSPARVIYVGERHTEPAHHQIQLDIIRALVAGGRNVRVGMEMFDTTYQMRLDQWSTGQMGWEDFLKRSHWYANWKYDDALYKEILLYVKSQQLRLIALNIPFHLPRKIAVGGLDNLLSNERKLLPRKIDTTNADHRAYVENVFKMHKMKGRDDFENFYAAQCAWEDGMARSVADNLGPDDTMVVVAGNGHIIRKFGIPNRAFKRSQAPFKTIYLATPQMEVTEDDADFIWVTSQNEDKKPAMHR